MTMSWVLNTVGTTRELLGFVKLAYYGRVMRKQRNCLKKRLCKEQCPVDVGEEDHVRFGETISARGPNLPWMDQSE